MNANGWWSVLRQAIAKEYKENVYKSSSKFCDSFMGEYHGESGWAQLATVDREGYPRNRTIVCRAYTFDSCTNTDTKTSAKIHHFSSSKDADHDSMQEPCLVFCTDLRSDKIQKATGKWPQLTEACWYYFCQIYDQCLNWVRMFPTQSLQVRLRGKLHQITSTSPARWQTARQDLYMSLSQDLKSSFFTKYAPGAPIPSDESVTNTVHASPPPEAYGDNFVLLLLEPETIDFLWLQPIPKRQIWKKEDHTHIWQVLSVQP